MVRPPPPPTPHPPPASRPLFRQARDVRKKEEGRKGGKLRKAPCLLLPLLLPRRSLLLFVFARSLTPPNLIRAARARPRSSSWTERPSRLPASLPPSLPLPLPAFPPPLFPGRLEPGRCRCRLLLLFRAPSFARSSRVHFAPLALSLAQCLSVFSSRSIHAQLKPAQQQQDLPNSSRGGRRAAACSQRSRGRRRLSDVTTKRRTGPTFPFLQVRERERASADWGGGRRRTRREDERRDGHRRRGMRASEE